MELQSDEETLKAMPKILSVTALVRGTAPAAVYALLAYRFFNMIYRYTLRTGLIARYSAESLSQGKDADVSF